MSADFNKKPSLKGKSSSDQDLLDISEIEKLINLHDPDFMNNFADLMNPENELVVSEELNKDSIKIDLSSHFSNLSKSWKNSLRSLFPHLDFLFEVFEEVKNRIKIFRASTVVYLNSLFSVHFPQLMSQIASQFKLVPDQIKLGFDRFGRWPIKKRLLFMALIIATVATGYFIRKMLTSGIIPEPPSLFIHSLEEGADEIYHFDSKDKFEPFYESNRSTENLVLIPKLMANIKPSKDSGSNPMAAVEVFVEGSSSEAMIEIKDREPEFKDQFSRLMEEMTFSELSTPEGKRALTDMFKKSANSILTTGTVHRVFIKTIILKP